MSGEQEEEGQAKRLIMEKRILEKLDQLIGVAKKAEVNDKEIFKKALDDLVNGQLTLHDSCVRGVIRGFSQPV
ncbi:hypothetical protein NC652_033881 [Populus alba x Populus x berolinensis]|nr:hypothetical protein NC652_033881 [Populus alba x Populus x berolinensis]